MNELIPAGRMLARQSLAENTRRAYGRAIERVDNFLDGEALTDHSLAAFIEHLFLAGLSAQSATQAVAAVSFRAKLAEQPSPVGPITRRTLNGYTKASENKGRGQAEGLRWEEADMIAKACAGDGLAGKRDAALIAIMSDGLLRVSEAAAIEIEHILFRRTGAALRLPRSKTDQAGQGTWQFLGDATRTYVAAWIEAAALASGPLFRAVWRETVGSGRITARTVTRIIQRRAGEVGMNMAGISGHSLRVGSAQSLAHAGASLVEMQQEGRWKSPRMPAHYAAADLTERRATARLRYGVAS